MLNRSEKQQIDTIPNLLDGKGQVTFKHFLKPEDFTAKVRLCTEVTVPAGASIGFHKHQAEDEVYIITAGVGTLDDGSIVKAGDAILTKDQESHGIENKGTENLVFHAIIACY